jgi:hypothetical protein
MSWLGWMANALLCYQWWSLGHKYRHGLFLGIVAGCMWAYIAIHKDMWDLLFIEIVLTMLQLRAWIMWGNNERHLPADCPVCSRSSSEQ